MPLKQIVATKAPKFFTNQCSTLTLNSYKWSFTLLIVLIVLVLFSPLYNISLLQPDTQIYTVSATASTDLRGKVSSFHDVSQEYDGLPTKKYASAMPIEELSIIGERNSGTRWMSSHLKDCFNDTILVRHYLVRYKHWFQHDVPNGRERRRTLVVAMFRDPYYWVEAMRKVPHHAPLHYKLGWEDFVTTPWTMPRAPLDLELRYNESDPTNIKCQEYFQYHQINSCLNRPFPKGYFDKKPSMSGHQPQYELRLDGSGRPYGSILDMRSDKIKNHLSVAEWDWVEKLIHVRYEDLLKKGTHNLIRYIEQLTGAKSNCDPYPPQDRHTRPLEDSYISWMTKFVDWETEALIGYRPWNDSTSPY
jgi:hypothetical protein